MRFEHYMAMRYLLGAQGRPEGRRFIRFIIYVAVGGVALGVAALLLALAIVRGFSSEIQGKIMAFGSDVQVASFQSEPLTGANDLLYSIRAEEGVVDAVPVVQEFVLLRRSAKDIDGVSLVGTTRPPPYLVDHLVAGDFSMAADSSGLPGLVIGQKLAGHLGIALGDRVTVFSMRRFTAEPGGGESLTPPKVRQFHVSGIYETFFAHFDELNVYTSLEEARELFDYAPDQVSRINVSVTRLDRAQDVASALQHKLGFPAQALTVFQVFRQYFAWVRLQESMIPLVIGVIVLVAAFNIIGTLLMILLEKVRDVGILQSMGASPSTVRRLFLRLGVWIGGAGTGIGSLLALSLALIQKRYGIIPLPAEAYYMESAPIQLNGLDFIIVGAITLVLCMVAAYFPARGASRLDPLRAIRFR